MNPDGPTTCAWCGARLGRRVVSHYCKVSGEASQGIDYSVEIKRDMPDDDLAELQPCDGCGQLDEADRMCEVHLDHVERYVCTRCVEAGYLQACNDEPR